MKELNLGLRMSVFARTLLFQSCWSFEGMQNLGLLYGLDPWLRHIYPTPDAYRAAAFRHLEYFNTHPYMAGLVTGVIGGMEERLAQAPEQDKPALRERVRQVKKALGSTLAAIGDSLFWGALRPAFAAGILFLWIVLPRIKVPHPFLFGALVFFCTYNAFTFLVRWEGLRLGYRWGEELPLHFKEYRWQNKTLWVRRLGLAAALIVSAVKIITMSSLGNAVGMGGLLLLGCAALRFPGVSTLRIYAATLAVGGLIAAAKGM